MAFDLPATSAEKSAIGQHQLHRSGENEPLHPDWSSQNQHLHKSIFYQHHSHDEHLHSKEANRMLHNFEVTDRKGDKGSDARDASLSGDRETTRKAYDTHLKNPENYRTDQHLSDLSKGKDILAVTVRHSAVDQNDFVEKEIPALAKAGVKVFGSEFLPSGMQKTVDDYAKMRKEPEKYGKEAVEAQRNLIKEGYNADTANSKLGDAQRNLMRMVDGAIDNGMKVVCMEPNITKPFHKDSGYELMHNAMTNLTSDQESNFRKLVDKRTTDDDRKVAEDNIRHALKGTMSPDQIDRAMHTFGEAKKAGMDFSKEKIHAPATKDDAPATIDDANWQVEKIRLRNLSMATTLGEAMKNTPGAKAMTVTGYEHFGSSKVDDTSPVNLSKETSYPSPTVNELIAKNYGKSTATVLLAGEKSTEAPLNAADRGVEISGVREAIEDNGLQGKRVTIKPGIQFDYIMNVPTPHGIHR